MTDSPRKLLIVEDDPGIQSQLRWCFEDYEVIAATDRATAINELRRHEPAVVLQDLGLPPDDSGVTEGFATLREILKLAPFTKVVVVTGHGDQGNAVKAVGLGAYDFYQKPVDVDMLQPDRAARVSDPCARGRESAARGGPGASPLDGVIAASDAMLKVCRTIEKVAPTTATALLQGESGTGKELLARAMHALSPRRGEPFVAINCAAIPDTLLESELFGYEKGAFTGAHASRSRARFELADGGTLFLDEIGDMPLRCRRSCCGSCRSASIERVGGREEIPVDVRIVCATNENLRQAIATGAFREDLYYRISEITIDIPPLARARRRAAAARAIRSTSSRNSTDASSKVLRKTATTRSRPMRGPATSARWRTSSRRPSSWPKVSSLRPPTWGLA